MAVVRIRATGMTLIEVMVVLLLISIGTAAATSAIRSWQRVDTEIERLALAIETAGERARVRGVPIRFESIRHGYRFSHLDTTGNWQPITDEPLFAERALPTNTMIAKMTREGQPVSEGLVFGSDVVICEIEVVSAGDVVTLSGQVSGAVKRSAVAAAK
jgi:general secretion pathway protein H